MIFDYAVVNGELIPFDQARVSIFDPAYFSSFGVYETVKVDHGQPFYLEDHLYRLLSSARMIDLELRVDVATLAGWFTKLINVDPQATWSSRIIALGSDGTADSVPVIAIQATALATYPDVFYQNGAAAVLFEGQRFMPACKSLNALVNYLARRKASGLSAVEGILHHDGFLTEGSRSNLFAVSQGQLITPPESTVLSGITRDVILRVMQDTDYPVVETAMPLDLRRYSEVFISSTSMHVMPITKIEEKVVGNGQVGPVTKAAMAQFEAHYHHVMRTGLT